MCRAAIFGGMGEKGVPGEAPDAEGVGCRNEVAAEAVPRLGLRPCLLLLSKLCGVQEVGNRVGCSRQTSIETEGLISESDLCLLHSVLCAVRSTAWASPMPSAPIKVVWCAAGWEQGWVLNPYPGSRRYPSSQSSSPPSLIYHAIHSYLKAHQQPKYSQNYLPTPPSVAEN